MKKRIFVCLSYFTVLIVGGQTIDTLSVKSNAFGAERQIWVHIPADFKYQSPAVQLPVIYVLDGQHPWFVNPVVNTIHALKTNYELPNALVVVIPHTDRFAECQFDLQTMYDAPLYTFLVQEVEEELKLYNPGQYRLIVGHSFSASFALYAYIRSKGFFSSVIAHTPLNKHEDLIMHLRVMNNITPQTVAISIGSIDFDKDLYHREEYNRLKEKYNEFFNFITTLEANNAAHNAVPIVATPIILNHFFYNFSRRFGSIAKVNENYALVNQPESPEAEWKKIEAASKLGGYPYSPEIGELYGLASRYTNSNYLQHGLMIMEKGVELYPNYYGFHADLYNYYMESDPEKAKFHLTEAKRLVEIFERSSSEYNDLIQEINNELNNNGW